MFRLAILCALVFTVSAFSQGTGLTGQYYDTATFTTLKTTRTDATVNFSFSTAIPSGTTITAAGIAPRRGSSPSPTCPCS